MFKSLTLLKKKGTFFGNVFFKKYVSYDLKLLQYISFKSVHKNRYRIGPSKFNNTCIFEMTNLFIFSPVLLMIKGLKAFHFLILLYILRYIVFILCIHCSKNKNKMSCVFIQFYMLLLLKQKSQKLVCALPTYLYIIFTSYKYWKSTPQTQWCLKFNFVLVLKDTLVY